MNIPGLQVDRALRYAPGLQVHLWNLLSQVVLVLPVPPIGPNMKQRSENSYITGCGCWSGHVVGSLWGLEDRRSLGSLGSRERPARCAGQGFKQWWEKKKTQSISSKSGLTASPAGPGGPTDPASPRGPRFPSSPIGPRAP